jgi:hypothetical protein
VDEAVARGDVGWVGEAGVEVEAGEVCSDGLC